MLHVWLDGKLVPQSEALVSVFDHGLLYGDGCFEGIRAYGGRILKLNAHVKRLFDSAEKIRLKPPFSLKVMEAAIRETLEANELTDAYIRVVFTRGVGSLGLHPFKCPMAGAFIIADHIQLYPPELYESGMDVIVAKRPRIPRECLDPCIKSLNYLNNILAKVEAIDKGVLEAVMLNTEGFVAECTGDNIFLVKDGVIHGITRRFVMDEIAPACGHTIEERNFKVDELVAADEVFLTGTAAEVIGVRKIDDHVIGGGCVGPITEELIREFRKRIADGAPED
jgi:branched-chain amino acid aminotransferase